MKSLSSTKKPIQAITEMGGKFAELERREKSNELKKSSFDRFFDIAKKTRLTTIDPELHRMDKPLLHMMYNKELEKNQKLWEAIQSGKIPKVPENMLEDFFQMFLIDSRNISVETSDFNRPFWKTVKEFNDEGVKMITNFSYLNSFIHAKNIMMYLQERLYNEPPPQDGNHENGANDDGSDQNKQNLANHLSNLMSKGQGAYKESQKVIQQSIKEIGDLQQTLESMDMAEQGDEDDNSKSDKGSKAKGQGDSLEKTRDVLQNKNLFKGINLQNKDLNQMIKKSMESTVNYFSHRFKEKQVSIFDAETVTEIDGLELLHPALKYLQIEDIRTFERKYQMMLDVYIDASGSMSSTYQFGSQTVSCWDIARLMTLKLNSKKLVKDVYPFEYNPHPKISVKQLMGFRWGGGTQIDNSIQQVIKLNRPSIFITDACDYIRNYSDLVYFIGVGGAVLTGPKEIIEQYIKNNQALEYTKDNKFKPMTCRYN